MIKLIDLLSKLEKDIEILPTKGLQMVVDEDNKYSLLNRLDTHYTAKAYLLTKIILYLPFIRSLIVKVFLTPLLTISMNSSMK